MPGTSIFPSEYAIGNSLYVFMLTCFNRLAGVLVSAQETAATTPLALASFPLTNLLRLTASGCLQHHMAALVAAPSKPVCASRNRTSKSVLVCHPKP